MNCSKCGYILPNGVTCCPNCGTIFTNQNIIPSVEGQLLSQPNPLIASQPVQSGNTNQQHLQNQIQETPQTTAVNQVSLPQQQVITPENALNTLHQTQIQNIPQQKMPNTPQQTIPNTTMPTGQINSAPSLANPEKKKSKIGIIILIIIVISAVIFLLPKLKGMFYKPQLSDPDELLRSTSFFLPNTENKIAIFDVEGKQITGFNYIVVSPSFVNNTAAVKNDKEEFAIITSLGRELVPFGKYNEIKDCGAIYIAEDTKGAHYIYNKAGEFIKELSADVVSYRYKDYLYTEVFDGSNYIYFNYKGEEFFKVANVKNENTQDNSGSDLTPYARLGTGHKEYISIFYNNRNYIINILTSEVIVEFESPLAFEIAAVNSANKDELFLTSLPIIFGGDKEESKTTEYKLIKNKEIIYTKTHDRRINIVYFNNNLVEIQDLSYSYLLTETGEKNCLDKDQLIFSYIDQNNYLKRGANQKVHLYENAQYKTEFDCIYDDSNSGLSKYASAKVYVLKKCTGYDNNNLETDILIKPDGTIINNKTYAYVSEPDYKGNFVVSEDNKTSYLIDSTGKELSNNHHMSTSSLSLGAGISNFGYNNLYIGDNEDETETLFDTSGTEYVTANYIHKISLENVNDDVFALLEYDDHYIVYNITKKKEILKSKEKPDCLDSYITITTGNKIDLYSYITGKKFYSVED